MKKITAKPINHQSWILSEWGNRVGVITNSSNIWTLLEATVIKQYQSLDSLQKEKNWLIVFEQKELKEEPIEEINNIPVKHSSPKNIQLEPVASYTKKESSSVRFAAGYWGIRFANGWTPVFCPKIETVNSNETVGPFTSKVEMNTIIAQKNKQKDSL